MKYRLPKTESQITKEITAYLDLLNIEWHWRNQVYKGLVKSGAYLRTGKKGISDIIFIDYGYTCYLELKTEEGEQSADQKEFEQHCYKNNQPYAVIRSVDDLKTFIEGLKVIQRC